jgi:hypothetical protein
MRLALMLCLLGCTSEGSGRPLASGGASDEVDVLGSWRLEALPPEIETQLTHGCYQFLSAVHYSDPRLTFERTEVLFHADSIGGLAMATDQRFPYRVEGARLHIDTERFTTPPSVLIPCGAMPTELSIAPSGERLLENVAHCTPCAHEAAIDGVVGVTWVRD